MAKAPAVGTIAPEFELASTAGPIRLADEIAQGTVLLVFYPGDDTPVCTKQLCDYRDNLEAFALLDVRVIAINAQSLEKHEAFAKKHSFPFPLAADPDRKVCRAYGADGILGMTKRSLFLIGRDGRIAYQHTDLPIFRRSADELREVIAGLDLASA